MFLATSLLKDPPERQLDIVFSRWKVRRYSLSAYSPVALQLHPVDPDWAQLGVRRQQKGIICFNALPFRAISCSIGIP
jgi:hypothetical protein